MDSKKQGRKEIYSGHRFAFLTTMLLLKPHTWTPRMTNFLTRKLIFQKKKKSEGQQWAHVHGANCPYHVSHDLQRSWNLNCITLQWLVSSCLLQPSNAVGRCLIILLQIAGEFLWAFENYPLQCFRLHSDWIQNNIVSQLKEHRRWSRAWGSR